MVLVVVLLVFGVMILGAWLVDRHDRRQGRPVQDARQIAERVRAARRERRSARVQLHPGAPRPDRDPRPVKRGH